MWNFPNRITYMDNPLADGTVERVYSNGVRERRVMQSPTVVAWTDNRGAGGTDTLLDDGRIRRVEKNGAVTEGVYSGNGITSWNNGQYTTVNETIFPEPALPLPPERPHGFAGIMAGVGLGAVVGVAMAPGSYLDANTGEYALFMEEQQRQEALKRQQQGSGDSGGSGGDGGDYSSGGSSDDGDYSSGGSDFGGDSFG